MPGVDRECVTHFHACDCREAKFKRTEEQLAAADRLAESAHALSTERRAIYLRS
jgi:hypothetical protein